MIDELPFNPSDVKVWLVGVASAVAAAAILKSLAHFSKKTPNIHWSRNSRIYECAPKGGEGKTQNIAYGEIVIENLGNATAAEIVLKSDKVPEEKEVSLYKLFWWTNWYLETRSDELEISNRVVDGSRAIVIRNLKPSRLLSISYLTSATDNGGSESVLIGPQLVERKSRLSRYYSEKTKLPMIFGILIAVVIILAMKLIWG